MNGNMVIALLVVAFLVGVLVGAGGLAFIAVVMAAGNRSDARWR